VKLIFHEDLGRDGKDVIKFFESALLGLGNPEEDHNEGYYVEAGIEAECTLETNREIDWIPHRPKAGRYLQLCSSLPA
jgi:hypothetical protein